MYLKELTEIDGGSGDEQRVRDFIREKIEGFVQRLWIDRIGNLIALKKGRKHGAEVLVAAHMDEVSFMITKINEDGTLSFAPIGGIDPKVVVGKRLRIGEKTGVVGFKPVHLQRDLKVDRVDYKDLVIDIGVRKKEDVDIEVGSYAYFTTEYEQIGSRAIGKAFDDRVGCSLMIRLIHEVEPVYDTYFAFVVQEEVGLRGSAVVLEQINVDAALVLEGTTAGDIEGLDEDRWSTHLGDGPAITFMHRGLVVDERIFKFLVETARKKNLKYQLKRRTAGGTDAYRFATTARGTPVGVISVPARYIHSPVSMIDLNDYEATFELVRAVLESDDLVRRVRN